MGPCCLYKKFELLGVTNVYRRGYCEKLPKGGVLLSIIVPVYNVEKYIRGCVESLLRQSISDSELQIILVDDGSTDSSSAIVKEYADQHDCIAAIHKQNGGVSSARNAGLDRATGKYLAFVDGDDAVADGTFGRICSWLEKTMAGSARLSYTRSIDQAKTPETYTVESYRGSMAVWSLVVRRSLVQDYRFDTRLSYSEDTFYSYECSLNLRNVQQLSISGTPYFYRDNPMSATRRIDKEKRLDDTLLLAIKERQLLPKARRVGIEDEAELRLSYAVSAYIFFCIQLKKDFDYPMLKKEGLVPCRLAWDLLRLNDTEASFKGWLVNCFRFLLLFRPVSWIFEKTICK